MRPGVKHSPLPEKAAREIRQGYVQRYLKQFLRRVHPDLFQHHPKEQAQNSSSLQELLPLVGQDKKKGAAPVFRPLLGGDPSSPLTTQLSFYVKPLPSVGNAAAVATGKPPLTLVEHHLPLPQIPQTTQTNAHTIINMSELEQELRSWEMVRSFMELCVKAGVSVAEADHQHAGEQCQQLHRAVEQAKAGSLSKHPEKSLKEVFAAELQGSFAGSSGKAMHNASFSSLPLSSEAQALKNGGEGLDIEEQARGMIESNSLLFTSKGISRARLEKTVRKWLYWQQEDRQHTFLEQLQATKGARPVQMGGKRKLFRLQDWWRKVPLYVAQSGQEQDRILHEMQRQGRGGMIVVAQDATKEEMVDYLTLHLPTAQEQYRAQMTRYQQQWPQQEQTTEDDAGAQYLARMRAKYHHHTDSGRERGAHWRRRGQ